MPQKVRIALDAMGGDHGAPVAIAGAAVSHGRHPDTEFILVGDRTVVGPLLAAHPELEAASRIVHTDVAVKMNEKPSQALRRGRWKSSMWMAIDAVKKGDADAVVSAGNTGALMAISKLILRMAAGMERPAIVANWPTLRGRTAVLDVGANIACDAQRLVEFAILGAAFHHAVNGSARPTVGLLNVGSEEEKGHEEVREAHRMLREMSSLELDYHGFVEGDDIAKGTVDVVVTDAFTGNVALKTAEGLARYFRAELRGAFNAGPLERFGALIASAALRRMAERSDPGSGAPFLGLNGIVVKSHGGADARGFATAIRLAANLAASDFVARIDRNLRTMTAAMPKSAAEAPERTKA
jgi:glycerol-3-phosphate acyltransferase PlsX